MNEEQRALYIFLLLVGREDEADRFRRSSKIKLRGQVKLDV